jgi:3-hydroxyacyl-[acyl-carrier-protein] dehydratase
MPAQPLIDFDAVDLSTVVATKEEILPSLKQRGTFEMVDGVLHHDRESQLIVGFKEIRGTDWWASDHIPGRPIFPGALMIEGSAQLCSYDFLHRRPDLADAFVGFAGLNATRFRGLVEPDCRLVMVGKLHKMRKTMFTYGVQAFVERRMVFEAEVMGMVV